MERPKEPFGEPLDAPLFYVRQISICVSISAVLIRKMVKAFLIQTFTIFSYRYSYFLI